MKLAEESFVLPPDSQYPLYITAKRYRPYLIPRSVAHEDDDLDALTIIALHSTSFHKETWEPTLEAMFTESIQNKSGVRIKDVWAIDCPNHGYSGILNREVLKGKEFENGVGCRGYAQAVHRLLMCSRKSFGVDFEKKRLVGLGHSLGANVLLMLQTIQPVFPFILLIIVEPMVSPDGGHHLDALRARLVEGAKRRIFEWPDRESAFLSLKSNPRTKSWDERVLKTFVNHAIGKCSSSDNICLSCTREQEQAMYLDLEGATQPAADLTVLCHVLPIHLVLGLINDFLPRQVHQVLIDPASGRKYASITQIPDVGHLEIPDKLGALVYELLGRTAKL